MKTSLTRLKSSAFSLILVLSTQVWSKPVGQVMEIKGKVFSVDATGQTKPLKMNDHIEEKSEILVGEDGSVTINDYFDATYHLIEGSHLKFLNKSVMLKRGKVWVHGMSSRHALNLTTANGHADFWKGEFIVTFDQVSSKSQFLIVNGEIELSHVLNQSLKHTVPAGTFSVIDPEVESGNPRAPTKVGLNSLNSAMAEFKALPQELQLKSKPAAAVAERKLASTEEKPSAFKEGVAKGKIIFLTSGKVSERVPASVDKNKSAYQYYRQKVKARTSQASLPSSGVQIRMIGFNSEVAKPTPRVPASIKTAPAAPSMPAIKASGDEDFEASLRLQQASQPKRSKELESLVNDLKSF